MAGIVQQVVNRSLLLILLGLLGMMPATPPPVEAIEPLWAEAADLRALKSYAAAVELYEEIAALSPRDPAPLLAIGEIYQHQHRWPLAEDAFNRALARDGGSPRALAGLALTCREQGDQHRAVRLWEAALMRSGDLPGVRVRLAQAYLDLDRLADAEATLRDELVRANDPSAHLYLAMVRAL